MMINTKLKKFIERENYLHETEYYLSWADKPAKKYRCWVNRKKLWPTLQKYIDTRKVPFVYY